LERPEFEPRSDDGLSSALDRDALLPLLSAVISDFPTLPREVKNPQGRRFAGWESDPGGFREN